MSRDRLLIAGTVPLEDLPLTFGEVRAREAAVRIGEVRIPCTQGTGTLLGAAAVALDCLGLCSPPLAVVAGDIGRGEGSRKIYEFLMENLPKMAPEVLALHYCVPDIMLMRKLCEVVEKLPRRPKLIADAASMYAAKAAGLAPEFDLFTPDPAELSFLADPDAYHPAYINKHLFKAEVSPDLILQAYRVGGAARVMVVKGSVDYVVEEGRILETISEPHIPAMEAIGGTGDTLTGLASALICAGLEVREAAIIAARANRKAGEYAGVGPDAGVWKIIEQIPAVFRDHLCAWSGICMSGGR